MTTQFTPERSDAIRAALIDVVEGRGIAAKARRRSRWIGISIAAGVLALGGAGAATAGLFVYPGGTLQVELGQSVTETHSGTAEVELGAAPDGATNISMNLVCLSAGHFSFSDGAGMTCAASDIGAMSTYSVALEPGQHSAVIRASDSAKWQLTAKYTSETVTEWGVNASGESFGATNVNGDADLILAAGHDQSGNAITGYVRAADLLPVRQPVNPEDVPRYQKELDEFFSDGPRMIPLYESDGTTQIGTFELHK